MKSLEELLHMARATGLSVTLAYAFDTRGAGRTSKVPVLSDLRESGSLEQDADNVWFIYREELYDANTDKKGVAELHISKHRQGAVGVIPLRFVAHTTRFEDLTYRTEDY